jgi:hypothetical protein
MRSIKYHNEANILITVQNLTKREIKTMEQILSNMARCMFKLFQITWDSNTIMRTGE